MRMEKTMLAETRSPMAVAGDPVPIVRSIRLRTTRSFIQRREGVLDVMVVSPDRGTIHLHRSKPWNPECPFQNFEVRRIPAARTNEGDPVSGAGA